VGDFRSDPMDSREGRGAARQAYDRFEDAIGQAALPLIRSALERMAANLRVELLGFWLVWHLHGGFEGLERMGMHRATIYRKVAKFRAAFGVHPDAYSFPGVSVDADAYLRYLAGTDGS